MTKPFTRVISWVALVGVIVATTLLIPPEKAPARSGPGVARVSVVEGSAIVQRGDSRTQTKAVRNAPMLPGDYISTGSASRAELQFDGFTAVRLGGNVQARITSNDPDNRKMQLADGTVEIGMVRDGQLLQIDTPSVTVRARRAGDYRISIGSDGSSWITARRGDVDVATPAQAYTLETGKTLVARGTASQPAIGFVSEVALDSFDDFNVQRDRTMVAALNASPNLNPAIAGFDNLAAYGQWRSVAGYGQSWVPNEPAGWVPYRNGSWTWEDGYGWTWIGAEQWGWTPYHYGNWFYCDCGSSGWAWLPPAHADTLSWSPALVGFFGFDVAYTGQNGPGANNCGGNYGYGPSGPANEAGPSGNGVPVAPYNAGTPANYGQGGPGPYGEGGPSPSGEGGPGNYGYPAGPPYNYSYPYIGWVPVAPYEPFYPWWPGWAWLGFGWGFGGYGYPAGFATSIVNITNITNVNRIYRNVNRIYRNFRHGGATGVTTRHFRRGTVTGHTVAVTARDVGRRFGTIHGAVPISPTRNNLGFSRGTVHAPVAISKAFDSPRFASDRALAARTSFAQQQKVVAQAIRGRVTGHVSAHAAVSRANAPISRASTRTTRMSTAMTRANAPETHAHAFQTRENAPVTRENAPVTRENAPVTRENAPVARENAAPSHQVEATRHESAPVTRENAAPVRENAAPTIRSDRGATMRANSEPEPWGRFNEARGEARSSEFPAGSERAISAPSEAGREERAPGDAWGRFSDSRGETYGGARSTYAGARSPYGERGSIPSYSRGAPSYSRGSYDSPYSRGSYDSPYSRGSYPSYSRGSYPSYSRGSYPSYSRGSYPSYPRGSYGSVPSAPRGYSVPPRSSGGGGGGSRHGGGGRPPQ
jgi:hypothetical protein